MGDFPLKGEWLPPEGYGRRVKKDTMLIEFPQPMHLLHLLSTCFAITLTTVSLKITDLSKQNKTMKKKPSHHAWTSWQVTLLGCCAESSVVVVVVVVAVVGGTLSS